MYINILVGEMSEKLNKSLTMETIRRMLTKARITLKHKKILLTLSHKLRLRIRLLNHKK